MGLQFLFLILNLFLVLYLIFLIVEFLNFLTRKIPTLPSSRLAIKSILEILKEEKEKKVFVDLGCGLARVLIAVKKRYPQMEVIGYENLPTQFFLAKIALFFSGIKAKIFYKNLFQADLTKADIIFCYLSPHLMPKLEKKFEEELKSEALIISNTFPLPNWKPTRVVLTNQKNPNLEKLFIYEKRAPIDKFKSNSKLGEKLSATRISSRLCKVLPYTGENWQ